MEHHPPQEPFTARTRSAIPLRALVALGFIVLISAFSAAAQDGGAVSGVVINSFDGKPIPGATVTVRGTTLAAQTDTTGRFELKNLPTGDQVLRISKSSFAAAVVTDVRVITGQTTTVNGNLRPEFYEMEEYEVTAEEFTQQTEQIMIERQESSGMMDAMGSEDFKKLGVGDAAAALGKVTGASIADGKFAVVRGLPDRYTTTTMNGGDVPSADPNRRAVQLDLFPSQFIDQLNVRKTFTPDMPGNFSGGAIDIVTKTFPEKQLISLSIGTSYNPNSNLRDDFLITDHGSKDWLARDDGTRALSSVAAAANPNGTSNPLNPAIKSSFESSRFSPVAGSSPVNSSMSLTFGDNAKVLDRRLGVLAGIYYKQDYASYSDGEVGKYVLGSNGQVDTKTDAQSKINYTLGGMATVGYEMLEDHDIAFNFLHVSTAEDLARRLQGQDTAGIGTEPGVTYLDQSLLQWTERTMDVYQFKGNHLFPALNDVGFDWVGSLAKTTEDSPDQRIFQFVAAPGDPNDPNDNFYSANGATKPSRPTRIWRELAEDNVFFRGDLKIPLPSHTTKDNAFKSGASFSDSKRDYKTRTFDVRASNNHPFLTNGDPNSYLASTNLGFIDYYNFPGSYVYDGKTSVQGYYGMAELYALEWLQILGGARFEAFDLEVTYDNLGTSTPPKTGGIKQNDVLPSLGGVISIRSNLLLRASWSQTVVRPTYREISEAELYDTAQGRTYIGNPDLKVSSSENFDLRLEWFPRPSEIISLSLFKKIILDPIEQGSTDVNNEFIQYNNYDKADVQGFEFEFRKNLDSWSQFTKELSFGFNFTYIESEVLRTSEQYLNQQLFVGQSTTKRPMFDQPEYILNTDLTWDHKPTGTAITVSSGIVGRRLTVVGLATPDEYEEPTPQLDLLLSQSIGKHWKLKLSGKNLLDPSYDTTQDWITQEVKVRSYTKGRVFGLTLTCEF